MNHRIRVAGILVHDNKVLLIKYEDKNKTLWVPPGGGIEPGDESTVATVKREVFEESGLTVEVGPLMFIREFFEKSRNTYHVEQFYLVNSWTGDISLDNLVGLGGDEHVITMAKWVSRSELDSLIVYPEEIRDRLWQKLNESPLVPEHLGVQIEGS